jgi:Protein of unknown function (DUF3987)
MKATRHIDHDEWTEDIFEPDEPDDPTTGDGKANGHAQPASGDAWPVLDQAVYHGLAGDVVNTILPHTEADPVALLLQFLVSFGNAIGRQPYYFIEGAEHYPVLFALLAGATAKGRKGTAANRIRPIFNIADSEWSHNNITSGISSGEGILHAIHDDIFGTDKKTGMQVLIEAGVDDKRMLLDEREFSAALDSMQREGNVVSRVVRDAWDCPRVLRTLTKHNPTKVTEPHISILGQITIDEVQRKLDQGAMMSGFANRFLYACTRRSKLLPHGGALHSEEITRLGTATRAALTAAQTLGRRRITMTSEAHTLWCTIYPQLSADVPGLLGAATARGDAQTLRLSMVYALLDQASQIDVVHIKAALALWTYCEASARFIFGDYTGNPIADNILRALRNSGSAGMSRWNISQDLFHRHTEASKIQAALAQLLAAGKVRSNKLRPANGRGRPTEMWFAV